MKTRTRKTSGVSLSVIMSAWHDPAARVLNVDLLTVQYTQIHDAPTRVGSRLEFWRKSLRFFIDAPVIGHGTGSTRGLFEQAAFGIGVHAEIVSNPHNQTLNVAVQWGSIGVILLYAMWLIHLSLFRGEGLAQWIGLAVVAQNIFTSMFNSHLFDFQEGWIYVLGVGVAGGMSDISRPISSRATRSRPAALQSASSHPSSVSGNTGSASQGSKIMQARPAWPRAGMRAWLSPDFVWR
jgi:hypothetical protein